MAVTDPFHEGNDPAGRPFPLPIVLILTVAAINVAAAVFSLLAI